MKLPDALEHALSDAERLLGTVGGQQAGTPRLRGLRAAIETELARRRAIFVEYARHRHGCQKSLRLTGTPQCTCGLDDLLD